ncbi:hypothetical protein AcV5_008288 [Taiwanofungus camphoratus]|nr:hypothetical protein AcV5_008288 [Antrodia cinnamomea]
MGVTRIVDGLDTQQSNHNWYPVSSDTPPFVTYTALPGLVSSPEVARRICGVQPRALSLKARDRHSLQTRFPSMSYTPALMVPRVRVALNFLLPHHSAYVRMHT